MKKISRTLIAALISICCFSSCVEEMAPVAGGDIQLSETIRIRATIDNDTQTKVALGESTEGVTKVEWAENDSFILTVDQQDYTFVRVQNISSTEAEFAYDGQNGTFPESFSAGTVTASYPAETPESYAIQTGTESGIGTYMTMAAETVVEEGQSIHDITVSFRHTSSVVRATLTDPAFAEKDIVVTLAADGLLESGKTIRISKLRADGNGTVTAYIGVPMEGESLQLTNCTIEASVNDVPYRATLGDKAFTSGKIYKVAKSDLQLIEYEVATDGTYTVYTADGLIAWNNTSDSDLILGADIDVTGKDWTPHSWKVTIDGNNKSIIGLTVNTGGVGGFLHNLQAGGVIKNLTLRGGSITSSAHYAGGIVGINFGQIINCRNENTINGTQSEGGCYGGIVGINQFETALILSCCNAGTVNGVQQTGGIAGINQEAKIIASYNIGDIFSDYDVDGESEPKAGGIVAANSNGIISACYNTGTISNYGTSGSFIGLMSGGSINDCYYDTGMNPVGYLYSGTTSNLSQISDGNWSGAKETMNSALSEYDWVYVDNNSADEPLVIRSKTAGTPTPENPTPGTDDATDLSADGTANSYIVSESGAYKFKAVKGNSNESVEAADVKVLWESFGTNVTPSVGDLVSDAQYNDGYISFNASSRKGNAVIAAVNSADKILWSWHIWLTDQPEEHEYFNNAGTMMDRNLGATSATPGDVGALGLMYQWGRKDPFLGSSSISEGVVAASTITWPSYVRSDELTGTIAYATANPTTFITYNDGNNDWYYTGSSSTDNTRWTTSNESKSIYDPCPVGWRVPDGDHYDGVWSKALEYQYETYHTYDRNQLGMNFSGIFGEDSNIWYPASGFRDSGGVGRLDCVGIYGSYGSASPDDSDEKGTATLFFTETGSINTSSFGHRSAGTPVRCVKITSPSSPSSPSSATDLSADGTANSYIVSASGAYKFKAVKGNSNESVEAADVKVLWESFGTNVTPSVGDLVSDAQYNDGYISFNASSRKGNAVIAAVNSADKILWSWHIWLTDQPEEHEYFNNAGTMMDRNLGATSATPGDVGALGLMYQWGRKDPFLGSSSISEGVIAASTITWPSYVSSDASNGTIEYATANPTTFIGYNSINLDWQYNQDNTRWQSEKTVYDPCPAGWRVPDGGEDGVWSRTGGISPNCTYDSTNQGMNLSGKLGDASTIWYPASGHRDLYDGSLYNVSYFGTYWSASPNNSNTYTLFFTLGGDLYTTSGSNRAYGQPVRCIAE